MAKNITNYNLDSLQHYQDDYEFIGPRLPKTHPAYRAHLAKPTPTIKGMTIKHGAVFISGSDLMAAHAEHGDRLASYVFDAVMNRRR
jgi:hypothetical protein